MPRRLCRSTYVSCGERMPDHRYRDVYVAAARQTTATAYPRTPDGRYFVVGERLWRCTDPRLAPEIRERHVAELMDARRAVGAGKRAERAGDPEAANKIAAARRAVQAAKVALGERGPVWWSDGAPDQGGRHPRNTSYAEWYAAIVKRDG